MISSTEERAAHAYIHRKDDYHKRLRRIEGQARGLQEMVEDEEPASTSSPRCPR